jgi:hypothetical protein
VSYLLFLQLLVESAVLSEASSALPQVKVSFYSCSGLAQVSTPDLDPPLAWRACGESTGSFLQP